MVHRPTRLYHKGKYNLIIAELNKVNWEELFQGKTVQECWDIFKSRLEVLVNLYVPMSSPKDYNEPWMNNSLLRQWKKKYFAWKRYTETKGYQRYEEYKKEAGKFKKWSRRAKRCHEKRLARGVRENRRAFFKYVNSKLTVRPEISEIRNELGILVDSDKDISNAFVKYFSSVHTPAADGAMPEMEPTFRSEIRELVITRDVVLSKLKTMNVNKSCGPDNMHPMVLRMTAIASCIPLELIFNMSIRAGEIPNDWRTANVTPIHKKGDRTEPCNYRPVSLTSQVCKLLEAIIRKSIVEHLERNGILSDKQHGFREGRSCLTNLLELMESWTEILDEGDGVDVAYLDFRKAFDLVSHRHLLYKMEKYGITGELLGWVKAFLSDRTQQVVIRGTASESHAVTSGVPQGSVLGPTLFLIFINDLPLEIISPISLFADDSKIFTRIISDRNMHKKGNVRGDQNLQNDLARIKGWADKWMMQFNVEKCKVMHLGDSNPRVSYYMGGSELAVSAMERDLGVIVDEKLEFDKHIKTVVNKANRMLGLIKIGFNCLDEEIFMNLYPVLVRPLLEYCVQVWSPYKQKYIDLIEGVQRRATRLVPSLKNLSYEDRLRKLKLTTLVERRFRGDMIETYKIVTGKERIDPSTFFTFARERGDQSLARGYKLYKTRGCKKKRRNAFSLRVVNPWNKLSRNEVNAPKTSSFKANFDKNELDRRDKRAGRDGRPYNHLYHVVV